MRHASKVDLHSRFSSDLSIRVVVIFEDENLETTPLRSSFCGTYDLWAYAERTENPYSRSLYMGPFLEPVVADIPSQA